MDHVIDTTKREMQNHRTVSNIATQGTASLLWGVATMTVGGYILAIAFGFNLVEMKAPQWVLQFFAFIFLFPGLYLTIHGIRGIVQQRKAAKMRNIYPDCPWKYDFPWNSSKIQGRGSVSVWNRIMFAAFTAVFMLPFCWLLKKTEGFAHYLLWVYVFFCGFMIVVCLVTIAKSIIHSIKFGKSFLFFNIFPFFIGEKVEGYIECAIQFDNVQEIVITLRCIHEKYEERGDNGEMVISYSVYSDQVILDKSSLSISGTIPISFDLPTGLMGNDLVSRPARYWEIAVAAKMSRGEFASTYLLPVYERNP